MKTFTQTLSVLPSGTCEAVSRHAVLFDIETTGLSAARSHLYMIGAASHRGGTWTLTQWFPDRPAEELLLLQTFSEYLSETCCDVLCTYNGDTFDLPYLRSKYAFYGLACPFDGIESLDLYRVLRPYRHLCGLSSMKQKDVERFAGIMREDTMSGKELIQVYHDYLRTGSSGCLELLLLHNRDDLLGLAGILPVMVLDTLFRGRFSDVSISSEENGPDSAAYIAFRIKVPGTFPAGLLLEREFCTLEASSGDNFCVMKVRVLRGTLLHFFADYSNYWYLPEEDQAIHKSVAQYVDKDHRIRASAASCYQKASGLFIPQPSEIIQPVFRRFYKDKVAWLRVEDLGSAGADVLREYAAAMLGAALREKF